VSQAEATLPDLTQRFASLVGALCGTLFRRANMHHPLYPLLMFVQNYIGRTQRRFARLVARCRAGDIPPPIRPRAPRGAAGNGAHAPEPPAAPSPGRNFRLPGSHAWLLRTMPLLRDALGQLEHLLRDPDLLALMQAAPDHFRRVLRPLCRLMGATPGDLAARRILNLPLRGDPRPERSPHPERSPRRARSPRPAGSPRRARSPRAARPPQETHLARARDPAPTNPADTLIMPDGRRLTLEQFRLSRGQPAKKTAY
jgi:hypothetical protein